MNPTEPTAGHPESVASADAIVDIDTLHARFALRVAACLTEGCDDFEADVSERLRFARERAMERASSRAGAETGLGMTGGGAALLGGAGSPWWIKFASALPMLALVAGLVLIQRWQGHAQISVAAEVDAALLADDLPPRAYSDAGFAEFLRLPGDWSGRP